MDEKTYNELNGILKGIDEEIVEKQKTVISAKSKAQIKNLIDKVDVRGKLPNFKADIEVMGANGVIKTPLTLSDFLKAINTDATKEDKQILKNLEIRAQGLRMTLENFKPKEEPQDKPQDKPQTDKSKNKGK